MVPDESADWLATYALGLVVAGHLEDAVTDLAEQAGNDTEMLDRARTPAADRDRRRRIETPSD
jgi:hypothetical protein